MKNAMISVSAVEVGCPYCDAPLAEPKSGSFLWPTETLAGQWHICANCKVTTRIPDQKQIKVVVS